MFNRVLNTPRFQTNFFIWFRSVSKGNDSFCLWKSLTEA